MVEAGRISAVVLAAGQSKRMGQNKLLMQLNKKPILMYTLEAVGAVGFFETILVTTDETAVAAEIPGGFKVLINREPQKGQGESVRIGAGASLGDYIMFFTADMPWITENEIRKIISCAKEGGITVPYVGGSRKNPCIFPGFLKRELLELGEDAGGRKLFEKHGRLIRHVKFENEKAFKDIDTMEDYLGNV
ncbi:MAG: nucleotidyltransferase family protein [Oscillospiraceae bacterium]|nr:nucleotidyltransferase family protein [Oscillospiraceae bacterium]